MRLIHPRGIWRTTKNGDIKYDVAKLRHSICGDYDYIVNDLFDVECKEDAISYSILNSNKNKAKDYFDIKLSGYYNLQKIKIIEGLLFLSMIPLYKDNCKRQMMMYVKALELLNDVCESEKK